jgi:hypothetical protein
MASPPRTYHEDSVRTFNRRFEVMDDVMVPVLRAKTPAERLAIAHGMWLSARDMLRSILRGQHPDWTEEQVNRETARRLSHGAV